MTTTGRRRAHIEGNPPDMVHVYDIHSGLMAEIPRSEAAAGMLRYARSLGPGTPACAEWERRVAELAQQPIRGAL